MRTISLFLVSLFAAGLPVFGQSTLVVSPASLTFSYQTGGQLPAPQPLTVGSTNGFGYSYSISTNAYPWLSVFPVNGVTPSTTNVSINPSGLVSGTNTGVITIFSSDNSIANVLVTVNVNSGTGGGGVNPTSLGFTYSQGGTVPSSQTVTLNSATPGTTFSTTAFTTPSANWLSVVPLAGITPSTLTVSVNTAGLTPGTYNGQVNVFVSGIDPIAIPVTLTVTAPGTTALSLTPATLTFNYQVNSLTLPAQQTVAITTPSSATYTVNAATVPIWMQALPASGSTNGSPITISVNPIGFAASTYTANVTITSSNGGSVTLVVTLNVTTSGSTGTASRFTQVNPCRVADTRAASGFSGTFGPPSLAGAVSRDFNIPSSNCGIPSNVQAYSLNITVVPSGPLSFLTTWPTGQTQPNVSTLNAFDGSVTSNAAIVPAGTNGSITLLATNNTDVVIDINGYFTTASGLALYTVNPCRVVDTRNAVGAYGGPQLAANTTRDFNIINSGCGVSSAAQAFSLNATVVPPGALSFLTLFPSGQTRPNVSTLNSFDGSVKANAAIVPGGNGLVTAFVTDNTNLVLDINAYFAPFGFTGGLQFYPLTPCRVSDTRNFLVGPITGNTSRDFSVQSVCGVPTSAVAYSFNVTVVPSGALSFLTLWPAGTARPNVSTLNSFAGKVLANAAIVPAGTNGAVSIFVTDTTHVVLDINGYFAP